MAGIMSWVVIWWVLEPVPLPITAIFGPCLAVLLGLVSLNESLSSFAHPIVYLFWGGFVIAKAMSVHGIDKRLALFLLTRKWIQKNTSRVLITLLATSTILSMWMTNLATTAMLLPVAIGILKTLSAEDERLQGKILIALAYASSIGGIFTPVGSTPNLIAIGMLDEFASIPIDFLTWMKFGTPIGICAFIFLIFCFRKEIFNQKKQDLTFLNGEFQNLGPIKRSEKNVIFVLLLAISLWLGTGIIKSTLGTEHFISLWLKAHLSEPLIAIFCALLLFILPTQKSKGTLSWTQAAEIDWGSLILFGGGLSLGKLMLKTGLASKLGDLILIQSMGTPTIFMFIIVVLLFSIFMTEFISNTATTNLIIPLIIGASIQSGFSPYFPALAAAIGVSMAFMLPVATPPNTVVFGSGKIQVSDMIQKGFVMNLASALIIFFILMLYH